MPARRKKETHQLPKPGLGIIREPCNTLPSYRKTGALIAQSLSLITKHYKENKGMNYRKVKFALLALKATISQTPLSGNPDKLRYRHKTKFFGNVAIRGAYKNYVTALKASNISRPSF